MVRPRWVVHRKALIRMDAVVGDLARISERELGAAVSLRFRPRLGQQRLTAAASLTAEILSVLNIAAA
jgi:hypothetical protein